MSFACKIYSIIKLASNAFYRSRIESKLKVKNKLLFEDPPPQKKREENSSTFNFDLKVFF